MRRAITSKFLLGCLLLGAAILAQAQTYNISWYKIAGGGGSSTGTTTNGTVYAVSGTIGQPDAGNLSGGPYSITGGFWGVVGAIQLPGSPFLTIKAVSPNVLISWPTSATGFTLQENSNLKTTNWSNVGQTVNVINGTNVVTIPAPGGNMFFRLIN